MAYLAPSALASANIWRFLESFPGQLTHAVQPGIGFSFKYGGELVGPELRADWKTTDAQHDDFGTSMITWVHASGLAVTRTTRVIATHRALEYTLRIKNTTRHVLPPLSAVHALCIALGEPALEGNCVISSGGGLHDTVMPPSGFGIRTHGFLSEAHAELSLGLTTQGGRSSSKDLPFFFLQNERLQEGLLIALGWSGQWAVHVGLNPRAATLTLRGKIPDLNIALEPGEEIEGPSVLIGAYEGTIHDGANRMRRLIREAYTPKLSSPTVLPAAAYSNWYDLWDEFDEPQLKRTIDAVAALRQEYFILDAGWYAGASEADGGFSSGLGNWIRSTDASCDSSINYCRAESHGGQRAPAARAAAQRAALECCAVPPRQRSQRPVNVNIGSTAATTKTHPSWCECGPVHAQERCTTQHQFVAGRDDNLSSEKVKVHMRTNFLSKRRSACSPVHRLPNSGAIVAVFLWGAAIAWLGVPARAADNMSRPIVVSPDGHFLQQPDGEPFFWLGDTAWELFHRLNRGEADRYLQDRARKGFTVVQAVATGKIDIKGLELPNPYGAPPFEDGDLARPNERYFEHVDWVVDRAARYGLRIAMVPMWGITFVNVTRAFNPQNAEEYGRWLGRRYRDKGIIWVTGGDMNPLDYDLHLAGDESTQPKADAHNTVIDYRPVYDALARGITAGEGGDPFITYHPTMRSPSGAALPRMSLYFSDRDWFDMSMLQTSHHSRLDAGAVTYGPLGDLGTYFMWNSWYNYVPVADEYAAVPARPVLDGEPRFEDHPNFDFNIKAQGYWRAHDVRNALYQALFAGAAGHTYGNFSIWDFYDPARRVGPAGNGTYEEAFAQYVRTPWQQALNAPGATQMQYAKALMLSRPYFSRVPDQALIIGDAGQGREHFGATRDRDGAYAMIYLPQGQPVEIDLSKLSAPRVVVWWFDPRTGKASRIEGNLPTNQYKRFTPPTSGPDQDWVLVIDDASNNFPAPGSTQS
jgi:hypothetical protein